MGCLLFCLQGEVGEQGLAGRPGEKVCVFIASFIHSSFSALSRCYALGLYLFSSGGSLHSSHTLVDSPRDGRHPLHLHLRAGVTTINHEPGAGAVSRGAQGWAGGQEKGSSSDLGGARKGGEEAIVVLEEKVEEETPGQAARFPGEGID